MKKTLGMAAGIRYFADSFIFLLKKSFGYAIYMISK
jgi:hypothetical protein